MKKLINKITVLILFLIITAAFFSAQAADHYVDFTLGSDSAPNNGSQALPWKTLSKINTSINLQPGDRVFLKRGETWREQLNITESGNSGSRITIGAYGTGNLPVINGSSFITTGWTQTGSGSNVWYASLSTKPRQIFFNNLRGNEAPDTTIALSYLITPLRWYYDDNQDRLYVYSNGSPTTVYINPGIQVCLSGRPMAINITGSYVTVQNIQIEKTYNQAINIASSAQYAIVELCTLFQWSNQNNLTMGGVYVAGGNAIVRSNTFGKTTGDDNADRNWAGSQAIYATGSNSEIHSNNIYHSAWEQNVSWGKFCNGIKIGAPEVVVSGITKIHNNYIYHVGGNAIMFIGYSNEGDKFEAYNNHIAYAGQAGISAYQTRGDDGIGGMGYVYDNLVEFANRIGWNEGQWTWWGASANTGTGSSGIHFNDGAQLGTNPTKPYIQWFCYDNTVRNSHSLNSNKDSDGIALDYNANRVRVYRNGVYNNDGIGIYIWNADNCKVYYNIVFGNDAGVAVTSADTNGESSNDNFIANNTFYHNYNGPNKGKDYESEIVFGNNSNDSFIKNNIFYSANNTNAYAYWFLPLNSTGNVVDNNVVYTDRQDSIIDKGYPTTGIFSNWTTVHTTWDDNSVFGDPLLINPTYNFNIQSGSPAINRGVDIGVPWDFALNPIQGAPDAGAMEYQGSPKQTADNQLTALPAEFELSQNYPNPFNPSTSIKFALPQDAHVTLKVYDILGNEVANLVNSVYPAGYHDVSFDAASLASGIYIYRLDAGQFNRTMKMMLLK